MRQARGSSRQVTHATVTSVVNTPTPTPVATSTPAPQPPIIFSFSVIPNQIVVNECVNISWNTGGGTTYVRIVRDGQTLIDGAPLGVNRIDGVRLEITYTVR